MRYTTETSPTENHQQYTSHAVKLMQQGQRQKGEKPIEPLGKNKPKERKMSQKPTIRYKYHSKDTLTTTSDLLITILVKGGQ